MTNAKESQYSSEKIYLLSDEVGATKPSAEDTLRWVFKKGIFVPAEYADKDSQS